MNGHDAWEKRQPSTAYPLSGRVDGADDEQLSSTYSSSGKLSITGPPGTCRRGVPVSDP